MRKTHQLLVFAVTGLILVASGMSFADNRAPETILAEIDHLQETFAFDRSDTSPDVLEKFRANRKALADRECELILELYQAAPEHPRMPDLLGQRWATLSRDAQNSQSLPREIDQVLFKTKDDGLKISGLSWKARVLMLDPARSKEALSVINLYIRREGGRGAIGPQLLFLLRSKLPVDSELRTKVEEQILKDFPDSEDAKMIAGLRRRQADLGKPFDLAFQDAITGSKVTTKDLRGKVIVIDFWATWCPPCIDQIPHLKEIYERYHSQGVEFIGVSLDRPVEQGGLDALKAFVAKNEMPWPQLYQSGDEEPANRELSTSWGVDGIPTVFVVDADGKLAFNGTNGSFEQMIKESLEKASAPAPVISKSTASKSSKKAKKSKSKKKPAASL